MSTFVTFPPALDMTTLPRHDRTIKLVNALRAGGVQFKTKRGHAAYSVSPALLNRLASQLKFKVEPGLDGVQNVIFNE
jgi:hypothetical protein